MRKIGIALMVIMVLIIGVIIVGSPPRFIRELGLPEVAKGLPPDFKDAKTEFTSRVRMRYAVGVGENELISQLRAEGFEIFPDKKFAGISRHAFPCRLEWWINWQADSDLTVTRVDGRYGGACL